MAGGSGAAQEELRSGDFRERERVGAAGRGRGRGRGRDRGRAGASISSARDLALPARARVRLGQLRGSMHDLCGENPSKLDIWMGLARGHRISCSCAHRPLRRARNIRVPFPSPGHGRTFYAPLVVTCILLVPVSA